MPYGEVSKRYDIADFNAEKLKADIEHDLDLLRKILDLVAPDHAGTGREAAKVERAAGGRNH